MPCAVVAFAIGDDAWVVDLRDGLTPDNAVRRGEPDAPPDVKVAMTASDHPLSLNTPPQRDACLGHAVGIAEGSRRK